MANTNETNAKTNETKPKANPAELRAKLLMVLCGVLALALIIVSAFAYEWNNTIDDLKQQNTGLRAIADTTTITSMSNEIGNLTMQVQSLTAENEVHEKTISEYEKILEENGLLPQ